jgi:FAD:protein FMN transferase
VTGATTTASSATFPALGGGVAIEVGGEGADEMVEGAAGTIRELHHRLTRFESDSELSRLNRDPRRKVPASPMMLRFAGTVGYAGLLSGGLVDATLLDAVELAGYTDSIDSSSPSAPVDADLSGVALAPGGPQARPAAAHPENRWRSVKVDSARGAVARPPGVRLDSGGLGKGLAADIVAERLEGLEEFAVSCVGDVRVGGALSKEREILVASPWRQMPPVASLRLAEGAIATSGITHRAWAGSDGTPAHHLIDPASGLPAFTGIVQATALAPTAVEAEVRAKAALLSGPEVAAHWLRHGGAIVLDGGRVLTFGERVEAEGVTA